MIDIPRATPHPTRLIQFGRHGRGRPAASLWPPTSRRLTSISAGILSDAQLESVIDAGEAHAGHLAGSYTVDDTYDLVSAAPPDAPL